MFRPLDCSAQLLGNVEHETPLNPLFDLLQRKHCDVESASQDDVGRGFGNHPASTAVPILVAHERFAQRAAIIEIEKLCCYACAIIGLTPGGQNDIGVIDQQ